MAVVKHVKLPNNEVVDVNDVRISGVDIVVTSGSSNVITSGGAYNALAAKQDTISDLATIRSGAALGATALQSYTETDPTVPAWAKTSSKPSYTASEVGAIPTSAKGAASGVAELDSSGKVPSSQLPSYVDDVLEYNSKSAFPSTGETGKIYVDKATNLTYRWSGTAYVEISPSLALGTTSSTAFRGDYGNTAYTHATNKGAEFSSGLYKITTNAEGHVTAATAVVKDDITALGLLPRTAGPSYPLTGDLYFQNSHYIVFNSYGSGFTFPAGSNSTTQISCHVDTDYELGVWTSTGWKRYLHEGNYTRVVNTTNFPGLNKTGTVTSLGLSMPTGFLVTNSPINSSGTISVSFASGYSLPTTAKQSNWDTAYGWGNHANAGYLLSTTAASTYVKKIGDTMTGTLTIQSGDNAKIILNNTDTDTNHQSISFQQNGSEYAALGIFAINTTRLSYRVGNDVHTIYHSGNLYLSTLAGSVAIGSSTNPVYYTGSKFAACDLSTTYAPYNSAGYVTPHTTLSGYGITDWLIKYDYTNSPDSFTTAGIYRVDHQTGTNGTGYDFRYGNILVLRGTGGSDTLAQVAFTYNSNNIYFRRGGISAFASDTWKTIWNSGNFTPGNYVLKAGDTITGSITFNETSFDSTVPFVRNITLTGGWNRGVVDFQIEGTTVFRIGAYGDGSSLRYGYIKTTDNDALCFYADGSLTYGTNTIYHSGNSNLSTVDWACNKLTAAGSLSCYNTLNYTRADCNYIKMPANGSLHLSVGESVKASMLSNGNVGIGTTTPNAKLHIYGASGEMLRLSQTSNYTAGAGPKITFYNSTSEQLAAITGAFDRASGQYANLYFGTRTSDTLGVETKMTILYNGNVGIGTTTPAYELDVSGPSRFFGTSDSRFYCVVGGAGISLNVDTSKYTGGWNSVIRAAASGTTMAALAGLYSTGETPQLFWYGGTGQSDAALYIRWSTKFVGIGTNDPSYKLEVIGNIRASGTITPGSASDTRLKNNITSMSISRAKDIILNARPVSFTWNDTATSYFDGYKGDDFGLLAQDVEPYIPQAIGTIFEKYKRLDYTKFITPLISVAQDHESRIQQLEQKLNIINN